MLKPLKLILLFLLIVLFFTTCKKYPENTLWLKTPESVLGRNYTKPWILNYYSSDDNDSTFISGISVYKEIGIYVFSGNKNYNSFLCPGILEGSIQFFSKKKNVVFRFSPSEFHSNSTYGPVYLNQKNIFLDPNLVWKIEKLCETEFWVSCTFNNIKYELHFK